MRIAILFILLGSILGWSAIQQREILAICLLIWGSLCAFTMAIAYLVQRFNKGYIYLLGKKEDGTRSFHHSLLFFPLILMNYLSLLLYRLATKEEVISEVGFGLFLSGRLLPLDEAVFRKYRLDAVLDVAGDWQETGFIRYEELPYLSIPLLDGTAPSEYQLETGVGWVLTHLRVSGNVLVHCAKGHGRSVIFVIASLIAGGHIPSPEQAFNFIKTRRPGVNLSKKQFRKLRSWVQGLHK